MAGFSFRFLALIFSKSYVPTAFLLLLPHRSDICKRCSVNYICGEAKVGPRGSDSPDYLRSVRPAASGAAASFCAAQRNKRYSAKREPAPKKKPGKNRTLNINIEIYFAIFTALVSRITVTFTCPGYVISVWIFCEISNERLAALSSVTFSLSTMTRSSRPAWMA